MRKRLFVAATAFMAFSVISWTAFADGIDVLLSLPAIGKVGVALAVDANVLLNNPSDPSALVAAGSATLLLGVPSAFLLANVIGNNPAGVRLWRNVSFFADLGLALVTAGAGAWMIVSDALNPPGGEDWAPVVGAVLIGIGIPLGASAWLDTVPYPMEAGAR